jgi:hypothetical protein
MSRISQETALKVAEAEADKKFNELISQKDTEISEIATTVFMKENKFPKIEEWLYSDGWVRKCSSVTLNRNDVSGYRTKSVHIKLIKFEYPTKCYHGEMYLRDEDGKVLRAIQAWEKTKEEKKKFSGKIRDAILTLGTPKKVRENIPELAKYFEDKTAALMIIPTELIKEVRKGLC